MARRAFCPLSRQSNELGVMTVNSDDFEIVKNALSSMGDKPANFGLALRHTSELRDREPPISAGEVFAYIIQGDLNDPVGLVLAQKLAAWDYAGEGRWTGDTGRNTAKRRSVIYDRLGVDDAQRKLCDARFPYAPALDPPIGIVDDQATGWVPWYTKERGQARDFYWKAYSDYLRDKKQWEPKNLAALDESTRDVVQRLTDPERVVPYQSKGLVVGYVQSGKTANFTGVVARAADAGYRLIIILAGTINILREQTQRRLDKELVGREMCGDEGYEMDEDYFEFISYGGFPSEQGSFDWERLTGAKEDFNRLKQGISALEFRRHDPSKALFHPTNLHRERVRLVVVKKNKTVLDRLLGDLKRIAVRADLSAIPTLVIDDESDQASINTIRPQLLSQAEQKQRTAINKQIVKLLQLLPRAQYVGYTATPFANVFVNPEDAEDLFPSDFIVSLPRPQGYMGMRDFYDDGIPVKGDYTFNENAFVRFVEGDDELQTNLPAAMDAFVLSGAMKLYREKQNPERFRYKHHTMLVHNSSFVDVHQHQAESVEKLFVKAGYLGGGPGVDRLRQMWEHDFSKVSAVRAAQLPRPASFKDLLPFIGECCRRVDEGPKPVLVVNGNNRDDAPNFEKARVWKILVGGTKLSRGYTVEGLTVSYYRRRAGAADTLMQMGRWFGFRPNYQDLVRLYIGRNEATDKKGANFINLYEAFRATCQDEEDFRHELKRYSSLAPEERITPKQVPPLVSRHMLPPTSPNKMFNARITFKNLGGEWRESTVAPIGEAVGRNELRMRSMLEGVTIQSVNVNVEGLDHGRFSALAGELNPSNVLKFLRSYEWQIGHEKVLTDVNEFLAGSGSLDPGIEKWLFLAPQPKTVFKSWHCNGKEFSIRERNRVETAGRYSVYSEPDHRTAAECFAGIEDRQIAAGGKDLRASKQGVFLFYPVMSEEERKSPKWKSPTMAFALLFPKNGIKKQIAYTVADGTRGDAVVVPANSGDAHT